MSEKYLYLPLEIVIREHDGKVTLAHHAIRDGWTVVLGPKLHLYAVSEQLPEGVFLIKSAVPTELGQIQTLKEHGHKVCSLDEEGVVTFKEFLADNVRFSKKTVEHVNEVFFWGSQQHEIFTEVFPEYIDKATVSGSPRLEFWRDYAAEAYKDQVKEIQEKYGRYILMPSSFGIGNNILGRKMGLELTQQHSENLMNDTARFMVGQAEQNLIAFKEYLDFMPDIAREFPDMNFVIRPHPSESPDVWINLCKEHDNLHFSYEGSVTPWILGSEAIYHFKSTTSIEAQLMGTRVLTYMPSMPSYMDKYVLEQPLAVSHIANTRDELISLVRDVVDGTIEPPNGEIKGVLKDWIYVDPEQSAADRLLDHMSKHAPQPVRNLTTPELSLRKKIRVTLEEFLLAISESKIFGKFLPKRLHGRLRGLSYGKHKYKGANIEHTQHIMDVITQLSDSDDKGDVSALYADVCVIKKAT